MIAITGATGFIGAGLIEEAKRRGTGVRGFARHAVSGMTPIGDLADAVDWAGPLNRVHCLIHLAGRAHIMRDEEGAEAAFERTNVTATVRLARAAVELGVRRFVFVSSIGVHGQSSTRPFTAADVPAPEEPYARSKLRAETQLEALARETGLELVIVRPPLVYGPGAPGNFARLLRLVRSGMPLPLGSVENLRSLVARDNLVDMLLRCAEHPAAAGGTFLVRDDEDLSTAELIRVMAEALGRPARLVPVPVAALRFMGSILGRSAEVVKLTSSLQVDAQKTLDRLDWRPPVPARVAVRDAVLGT